MPFCNLLVITSPLWPKSRLPAIMRTVWSRIRHSFSTGRPFSFWVAPKDGRRGIEPPPARHVWKGLCYTPRLLGPSANDEVKPNGLLFLTWEDCHLFRGQQKGKRTVRSHIPISTRKGARKLKVLARFTHQLPSAPGQIGTFSSAPSTCHWSLAGSVCRVFDN